MKRLWFALAVLLFLLSAALCNARYLDRFTADLSRRLLRAEVLAAEERWEGAETLVCSARSDWAERSAYLHVVLCHSDADQIQIGFEETLRLLRCREEGEYAAASARLEAQLRLVAEAERLTLENLF